MSRDVEITIKIRDGKGGYTEKAMQGRPLTKHFVAIPYQQSDKYHDSRKAKLWSVTHAPTGEKLAVVTSLKKAKEAALAGEDCLENVKSADSAIVVTGVDPKLHEFLRNLNYFRGPDGCGSQTWQDFKQQEATP